MTEAAVTASTGAETTSAEKTHEFSFYGTGREYFGIWIVNLLLTIVTVGIYSAWAKVRRLRYFYANTWFDGHNFEYHAKPMQILIGRIIAVSLFILYNVSVELMPIMGLVLLVPYLLALPWLINKALQFNARMTSYRNVHFGFDGSYGRALWVFIVLPLIVPTIGGAIIFAIVSNMETAGNAPDTAALISIASVGGLTLLGYLLMMPYISKLVNSYIANSLRLGNAKFNADIPLSKLIRNMGAALLISVGAGAVIGLLAYLLVSDQPSSEAAMQTIGTLGVLAFYVAMIVAYLVYSVGVRNIAFNATKLEGGHELVSNVPRFGYAWVIISNLLVSVATVGLMIPWAAIRTWRYLAQFTQMRSENGLDHFVADQQEQGNVAAAEYLDIDGIDFGL